MALPYPIATSVIAATRTEAEFRASLDAEPTLLFDLSPDLLTVAARLRAAHERGKQLYLHLDLARGIGKDESGLRYLASIGIDGIISTKTSLIKQAREQGLKTVQRFFIFDSRSVETTLEALRSSRPDMIEIMPGISPKTIRRLCALTATPVIAGGLIETPDEVADALSAGAHAVSAGRQALWRSLEDA